MGAAREGPQLEGSFCSQLSTLSCLAAQLGASCHKGNADSSSLDLVIIPGATEPHGGGGCRAWWGVSLSFVLAFLPLASNSNCPLQDPVGLGGGVMGRMQMLVKKTFPQGPGSPCSTLFSTSNALSPPSSVAHLELGNQPRS